MRIASRGLAVAMVIALGSCSAFEFPGSESIVKPKPPNVDVSRVRLSSAPTSKALASYYCAQYVGPLICSALGPVPKVSDIDFAFDVELGFQNPNSIPLPVVSALFAFTAFPQSKNDQNLGSVCLSFCEDTTTCAQDANACVSNEPEIRDARDFANAAKDFLIATALGERRFQDLRVRTVKPNDQLAMVVRLGLNPVKMVSLIRTLATEEISQVKRARVPEFAIPYRLEGSAWVSVQSFGRFASNFGPATGDWKLVK